MDTCRQPAATSSSWEQLPIRALGGYYQAGSFVTSPALIRSYYEPPSMLSRSGQVAIGFEAQGRRSGECCYLLPTSDRPVVLRSAAGSGIRQCLGPVKLSSNQCRVPGILEAHWDYPERVEQHYGPSSAV